MRCRCLPVNTRVRHPELPKQISFGIACEVLGRPYWGGCGKIRVLHRMWLTSGHSLRRGGPSTPLRSGWDDRRGWLFGESIPTNIIGIDLVAFNLSSKGRSVTQRSEVQYRQLSIDRRRLLAAGAVVLASTAMFRSAGAQVSSPAASPSAGEWTFTDDKGVTITLPERPVRIVADVNSAAPLWDFGIRPVAVFGWNATVTDDGDFGAAGGRIDPTQVEVVGDEVETIRLEEALAMDPDVIITLTWDPDEPTEYWSIDATVVDRVKEIAPILALSATGQADINLERSVELAEALGADLSTPEQQEQKARYETAVEDFKAVAADRADLTNVFGYIDATELIYIANPPDWGDLTWYRSLGLNIIHPDANPLDYWQELSREGALMYPSDVFWQSTRPGTLTPEEMQADPVLSGNPAIGSGQVGWWNQDYILSYQGMADALENLSAVLGSVEKVT